MEYKLEEIVDIPLLQDLQDKLNKIYSFPSAIIDNDGKILTAVAWQDICTKFHRVHPVSLVECIKSDQYILDHLPEANPAVSYQCPHGMIDNATPIIIDGKHLGNFFTGQFFLEKPDLEFFKQQAEIYGFDENSYLEAVDRVPIWTREKLNHYLDFIRGFIEIIAGIGLKNLKEIESGKKIKESEDRYKTIVQSTYDWVWEIDNEWKYTYSSDRIHEILGYTPDEIFGSSVFDFMIEEERDRLQKIFKNVFHNNDTLIDIENLKTHKNGQKVCLLTNGFPIYDEYNKIIGYRGVDKDITERKKSEEKLVLLKERYDLAVKSASIGVWDWEIKNDILIWDERMYELYGISKENFSGAYEAWIKGIYPEDVDLANNAIQLALNNVKEYDVEFRIVWPNNEIRHIKANGNVIRDNNGTAIRMVGISYDITERKKSEATLLESEERYRLLHESAGVGIGYYTVEGKVISFNKIAAGYMNGKSEDFVGKSLYDLYPKPGADIYLNQIKKVLSAESVQEYEDKIDLPTQTKWFHSTYACILDLNKKVVGIQIISSDITERKLAEASFMEMSEMFRTIFENSPIGIEIFDKDAYMIQANRKVKDLFGVDISRLFGKFNLRDDPNYQYPEIWEKLAEGEEVQHDILFDFSKVPYESSKKGIAYYHLFTTHIPDSISSTVGYIVQIIDISDRTRAEQALRESEEKFAKVFQSAPILISITDLETGVYLDVNDEALRIAGFNRDEVIGHKSFGIGWITVDDRARLAQELKTHGRINGLEMSFRSKNGSSIIGFVKGEQIVLSGSPCLLTVTSDITERKKAEELIKKNQIALHESNRRLEEALVELKETQKQVLLQERLRALGQMASGIAHDINNSLTPITGYLDLLLEDDEINQKAGIELHKIKTATHDISKTIMRMREFYRPKADLGDFRQIDISKIIKSTVELTKHKWKDLSESHGAEIKVSIQLDNNLFDGFGSESELREAMMNIIINSVDAMPDGGELNIKTSSYGKYVSIEIHDTGIGMDEETRKKCLEPFFSTKGERGTGLGLSMVYGIVQRHDGYIEIESEKGKGTNFKIFLPKKRDNYHVSEKEIEKINITLNVLIVDDEIEIRGLLEKMLQRMGHKTIAAESGTVGLEKFKESLSGESKFDLIISDLGMADMDGKTFSKKIKNISPGTPIILLTGWGSFIDKEQYPEVDYILSKPVTKIDLNEALSKCINRGEISSM